MNNNLNKQRVVVNKYTDNPLDIISSVFHDGFGEIVLSVKAGEEGIYIKNDAGEVIKIGVEKSVIENLVKETIEKQIDEITGERIEILVKEGIAEEETRAKAAEQELGLKINSEAAKAKVERTNIQKLIDDEAIRAINVEKEISKQVEGLNNELETLTNDIEGTIQDIITDKLLNSGISVHQDVSESQYKELIEKGEVTIINNNTGKKETIKYKDEVYYMIFDDIEEPSFDNNEVILENNWTPFETIVLKSGNNKLNLNNFKIIAPEFIDESDNSTNSYGLWVKDDAHLTIDGNGEVIAQDAEYSIAVWANGGTVIIKDGIFRNGGDTCDLIYASNGGKVYIYGGEFIPKGPSSGEVPGTKNPFPH